MKDLTKYRRIAERQGWDITPTRSGHLRWTSPVGVVIFSPSTPSDRRALLNLRAYLRRAGLVVD